MLKIATAGALAVALVPLVPRWIPAVDTPPVADVRHRRRIPGVRAAGHVHRLRAATDNIHLTGMRWSARSELGFAIAGGYFLGPGAEDGRAIFNAPARPTAGLLNRVWRHRVRAAVQRGPAAGVRRRPGVLEGRRDGRCRHRAQRRRAARAVDALTGRTGQPVGGVWLWDLR